MVFHTWKVDRLVVMVNFSYEEITISTLPTCFDPKNGLNTHIYQTDLKHLLGRERLVSLEILNVTDLKKNVIY